MVLYVDESWGVICAIRCSQKAILFVPMSELRLNLAFSLYLNEVAAIIHHRRHVQSIVVPGQ